MRHMPDFTMMSLNFLNHFKDNPKLKIKNFQRAFIFLEKKPIWKSDVFSFVR